MAAAFIINKIGAYSKLKANDFWGAVNVAAGPWASLPNNQPGPGIKPTYNYAGQGHNYFDFIQNAYQSNLGGVK